jgi:hypothetical protein
MDDLVLNLCILEFEKVPKKNIIGKRDLYVQIIIKDQTKTVWTTKFKKNKKKVLWEDNFQLPISSNDLAVIFRVIDMELFKDGRISSLTLSLKEYEIGQVYDQWLSLIPGKNIENGGKIRLLTHIGKKGSDVFRRALLNSPFNKIKSF